MDKTLDYDPSVSLNSLASIPSQILRVTLNNGPCADILDITLDSGATVSYLRYDTARKLESQIMPNNQLALLADQKTRMASLGEVDFNVTINGIQMRLRALVMKNLQAECFGGTTFHVDNGIEPKIKDGTVTIHGKFTLPQSNPFMNMPIYPPPVEKTDDGKPDNVNTMMNSCSLCIGNRASDSNVAMFNAISLPSSHVVFPSDVFPIPLPSGQQTPSHISISPSFPDAYTCSSWSPSVT